jgi:hypothetical protein
MKVLLKFGFAISVLALAPSLVMAASSSYDKATCKPVNSGTGTDVTFLCCGSSKAPYQWGPEDASCSSLNLKKMPECGATLTIPSFICTYFPRPS